MPHSLELLTSAIKPDSETSPTICRHEQNERALVEVPGAVDSKKVISPSQVSYASPPGLKSDIVAPAEVALPPTKAPPANSLVSPPTSLADDLEVGISASENQSKNLPETVNYNRPVKEPSPVLPTHNHRHTVGESSSDSKGDSTLHRRSNSREVAPKIETTNVAPPQSHTGKPSSRPTSSHRIKPGSPAFSISENKRPNSADRRLDGMSVSPASPQRSVKSSKRERVSFAEADADPESRKLIQELYEQDFGLRRRAART